MARFDVGRSPRLGVAKTENPAGGEAHTRTPEVELASLVLTSMLQDGYYESAGKQLARLRGVVLNLARRDRLLFAAQAAIYARHVHGLRSITHALAGEIARQKVVGGGWRSRFFDRVVKRPDDMPEIASYYIGTVLEGKRKNRTLSNAMKRGFRKAFLRFDEYQLTKWKGSKRQMTLRDLAHLVHPHGPKDSLIWKLRGGLLKSADTFETKLSKAGQQEDLMRYLTRSRSRLAIFCSGLEKTEAKATAWRDLVERGKLGYLAALRNLRNIVEQAPDCLPKVRELLVDAGRNRKALIFPFQVQSAAFALSELSGKDASYAMQIVSEVANLSAQNCPELEGRTLVALDDSGSMTSVFWNRKEAWHQRCPASIGALFAACVVKSCNGNADLMLFSDVARYRTVDITAPVLSITNELIRDFRARGTNFHAIFNEARHPYNRILILSDMQAWMGYDTPARPLNNYRTRHNANPHIYTWDLQSSATAQFIEPHIHTMAGLSDKVFDLMRMIEEGPATLVREIEAIEL